MRRVKRERERAEEGTLSESSHMADTEEATERSKHLDYLAKVSEIFGLDASGLAEGLIPVVHFCAIDFTFALDVGFLHPAADAWVSWRVI